MTNKLNAFFLATGNAGLMWWRWQTYADSAWRQGIASMINPLWDKELTFSQPWEMHLDSNDVLFKYRFIGMAEEAAIKAEVIVVQMVHTPVALRLFRSLKDRFPGKPILAEVDDHFLSVAEYNPAWDSYWPGSPYRDIAISHLKESDGIIVSTPYLKEVYSEFNANIWVVPNAIDFPTWDRVQRKRRPGIRIGWAGGASHEEDMRTILPAIKNVLAKHKGVEFVMVNGPAQSGLPSWLKDVKGVTHVSKWARIDKYAQSLAHLDFDIGIAPLVDNAFNRGKSNLRWLEYSALGIPTVASRVGHFAETCRDGADAFLADDAAEFEAKLDLLIKDRKLRTQMGARANARIRRDFNVDATAQLYVEALREAIALKTPQEAPFELRTA